MHNIVIINNVVGRILYTVYKALAAKTIFNSLLLHLMLKANIKPIWTLLIANYNINWEEQC